MVMPKIPPGEPTVITLASQRAESTVLAYADLFTARRNARIAPVRLSTNDSFVVPWGAPATGNSNGFIRGAVARVAREEKIGLIVSEWLPDPHDMQDVLRLAHEFAVSAIFFRHPERKPYRRVIVATAGGTNVLQQMWIARQMACALCLPVYILRIVDQHLACSSPVQDDDPVAALDTCSSRLLQMEARVKVKQTPDVAGAIAASVREGDMLVLGAPSALRANAEFDGSLPHTIARRVDVPLILLSTPSDGRISLRRLFWGDLIQPNLRLRDKTHAITTLIENLARHNQIAQSCVADTLDRALRREAIMSTAVDCETAFPHVTLPGFLGVAGSMAICPDGVAFESPDGLPTRFLFLLVTPDSLCDDYLAILGMIARRMLRAEVRSALLRCRTPSQVLDVLEPVENLASYAETNQSMGIVNNS